ncbi:MAG: toll/interleukin-1 receptor domain-containing protein, partial [Chloroflexi bacterium]|nr:toll/interleukin-1 receptor domain-containing protein [Chloroflexota bacterium]
MSNTVFLCYSRQELTFADCLRQELQASGLDVWIDIERLEVGEDWQPQIDKAVDHCSTLLLVVSAEAIASENVCREWVRAMEQGKRIVLLIFEKTPIHGAPCLKRLEKQGKSTTDAYAKRGDWEVLAACETIDFRQSFHVALDRLLDRLKNAPDANPVLLPDNLRPPEVRWFLRLIHAQINSAIAALLVTFGLIVIGFGTEIGTTFEDIVFLILIWGIVFGLPLAGLLGAWLFARRQFRRRAHDYGRQILLLTFTLVSMLVLLLAVILFAESTWEHFGATAAILNTTLAFIAITQGAVAVVQFVLLGSAGLYRWSGPSGIPRPRRHYRRNWMAATAIFVLLLLITIATGDVTVGVLAVLMIWPLLYLGAQRATVRFRRPHIEFHLPDQQMKVVVLHAPQDEQYAHRVQRQLKRY